MIEFPAALVPMPINIPVVFEPNGELDVPVPAVVPVPDAPAFAVAALPAAPVPAVAAPAFPAVPVVPAGVVPAPSVEGATVAPAPATPALPAPAAPGAFNPIPGDRDPASAPSPVVASPVSGCPKKPFTVVLFLPTAISRQSVVPVSGSTYFLRRKRMLLVCLNWSIDKR